MYSHRVVRLTRDPELKFNDNGFAICRFGVAWNTKVKGEEKSHFMECTALDKQAEVIAEHFSKGKQISIDLAEVQHEQWEKDGQKHSRHTLLINRFSFVGNKDD